MNATQTLIQAVENNDPKGTKAAIEAGANVDGENLDGTPLSTACVVNENIVIAKLLLEAGASIKAGGYDALISPYKDGNNNDILELVTSFVKNEELQEMLTNEWLMEEALDQLAKKELARREILLPA